MNQIENLHVCGYRRLLDVNLPLRPVNVLIGAHKLLM